MPAARPADEPSLRRNAVLPAGPVFHRSALTAAGWTAGGIRHAVATGRLLRVHQGWYADADTASTPQVRHALAVAGAAAAVEAPLVGTHESAALAHGMWLVHPYDGPPRLSLRRVAGEVRPSRQSSAALVSQLPPHHVTTVHGAAVTTLARTAVDLARQGDPLQGVASVDFALRRGVTRRQLDEVTAYCSGWPGIELARVCVAFGDPRSESPLESIGRWRFHEGGLPAPDLQVWFGLHRARDRADFCWLRRRTVGEADGMEKYEDGEGRRNGAGPNAWQREKKRDLRFEGDYQVALFHYDWAEAVYRADALVAKAAQALVRGEVISEARRRQGLTA